MVLTVSMPSAIERDTIDPTLTYGGSAVTLQAWKTAQFGRANQRWYLDESTGFIEAFHTDIMDKGNHLINYSTLSTKYIRH